MFAFKAAGGGRGHSRPMLVFKAAVVGAGTTGGEIAEVIANADIPAVRKGR